MDIAIVGAGGDVGRHLAALIIDRQVIGPGSRLQLVGRRDGASARALYGLRSDLYDAFSEITPEIDVALAPEEVVADIVLFTAGMTAPVSSTTLVSRLELARRNRPVFETFARSFAAHGHGEELFIVVTNPVELGVKIFSEHLGARRVLGMGAFQDTQRLRREIGGELGVRRQRVHAYMLGEHGDAMVPIMSQLWIYGHAPPEIDAARRRLQGERRPQHFAGLLATNKRHLAALLAEDRVAEAFRYAQAQPAEFRTVLMPLITHISGAKTAISTASVTVELIEQLISGGQHVIPAQVALTASDWDGPQAVLGVPVVCGLRGWSRVTDMEMDADERACLRHSAAIIGGQLAEWSRD